MPNLIAYDIAGVQPMTGPTGLIFAMRSRYTSQTGNEALFDEADTDFSSRNAAGDSSGTATPTDHGGTNPGVLNDASATSGDYSRGQGMTTASAEALGILQAISLLRWLSQLRNLRLLLEAEL